MNVMEKKEFIEINSNTIRYNLINLKQLVFEVTDACKVLKNFP
jgi:hypothetical protein